MTMAGMRLKVLSAFWSVYVVLLSLICSGVVLFATIRGNIGVSPDSVLYLSVARDPGKALESLTISPPFYPLVLAGIAKLTYNDPLAVAPFLNALLMAGTLWLSAYIIKLRLSNIVLQYLAMLTIASSVSFYPIFIMLWTEPLFIFLCIMFFVMLELSERESSFYPIIGLIITIQLLTLTRYIGIIFIFLGGACILLNRKVSFKRRLKIAPLIVVASAIPICIWIMKNLTLANTMFGVRYTSQHSLWDNIKASINTLLYWLLPAIFRESKTLMGILGLAIGLIIGFAFGRYWRLEQIYKILTTASPIMFQPHSLFIGTYIIALLGSAKQYEQLIDNRYLSPVFIATALLFWQLVELVLFSQGEIRQNDIKLFMVIVIFSLWMIYPIAQVYKLISTHVNIGHGYTSKVWINSDTLHYLSMNADSLSCTIYTNGADAIYFWLNREVPASPRKIFGADKTIEISSIRGKWPATPTACLVWFSNIRRKYLFQPEEILQIVDVEQIITLGDGIIYKIHPQ